MRKINFLILLSLFSGLGMIANISALENNAYNCPMGGAVYGLNGVYGSGTMILSWIISILLIILIIAGIYWFAMSANNKTSRGKK